MVNDPLYNHEVFGPNKGRGGDIAGKSDEQLVKDLINIHNAENWLGIDGDSELSMFKSIKSDLDDTISTKGKSLSGSTSGTTYNSCDLFIETILSDDEVTTSREASPYAESPQSARVGSESPNETSTSGNSAYCPNVTNIATNTIGTTTTQTFNEASIMPSAKTYGSVATSSLVISNNPLTNSIGCIKTFANGKLKSAGRKVNKLHIN